MISCARLSQLPEQLSGRLVRRNATTLHPAKPPSWSITAWTISTRLSKPCAKKVAMYLRRLTSPSMESLLGSSIRKETRWNYSSRLPANNKGCRVQCKFARRSHMKRIIGSVAICILLLGVSIQAQAPQGPPKPGPEVKRLPVFLGNWKEEDRKRTRLDCRHLGM